MTLKNTKIIKIILFTGLIVAMILPFSGMNFAEADQGADKKQRLKDATEKVKKDKVAFYKEKDRVAKIYKEYFSVKDSLDDTDKKRTKDLKAQLKVIDEKSINEYKIDEKSFKPLADAQKAIEASDLAFVAVDTKLRLVSIGFDISLESQSGQIKDTIETLIDVDYSVEFDTNVDDSCTSQTAYCNPIIGGLQIDMTQGFCTLGFPVMQGTTAGYITAGHCFVGYSDQSPNQGGYKIGDVTQSQNSGSCDCAFIDKSTDRGSTDAVFSGYNNSVSLSTKKDPTVGKWVVLTGATTVPESGFQVGMVNAVGVTYSGISDTARVIGMTAAYGDSGAPYYNLYASEFFGTHKGGNSTYEYMIQWENIANTLSVS